MKNRWLLCCGWKSILCVLDTTCHFLGVNWNWLCERHDGDLIRRSEAGMP